jgi:hypothetical protein
MGTPLILKPKAEFSDDDDCADWLARCRLARRRSHYRSAFDTLLGA